MQNELFAELDADSPFWNVAEECLDPVTYPKSSVVICQNSFAPNFYWIKKGAIVAISNVDGKEFVLALLIEGDLVLDINSYMYELPALCSYIVVEDVELLRFNSKKIQRYARKSLVFSRFLQMILEVYYQKSMDQRKFVRVETGTERYKLFMSKYAELVGRFPVKYIASFLRIQSETLSRIRKAEMKNK